MHRKKTIYLTFFLILLIFTFGIYNYLINIYEVIYNVVPDALYADNNSEVVITAVPINGLGSRALFREADAVYSINEGAELVDIIVQSHSKGVLVLKAKNKSGVVKITAKSKYSLLPSLVVIKIYPNFAEVIHEVNGIICENYYICVQSTILLR